MIAAEIAPFVKVGGLADVVGSLPPVIKKLGVEVILMMPLYGAVNRKKYNLKKIISKINIYSREKNYLVNVYQAKLPGTSVRTYFIDAPDYFRAKEVYAKKNRAERFLFFSLACLEVMPRLKYRPDVIHCHDFHTALIPDLLKARPRPYYNQTKTLYTIHNLNYQGQSEIGALTTGGLTKDSLKSLTVDARDGDINFMAQGIISADLVNTVSPTYAREITTAMYGAGLERVIRQNKHKIFGILNGLDTNFFNPAKDEHIKARFKVKSLVKKVVSKLYLQKKLGLEKDKGVPIVAIISRLTWQKGLELIDKEILGLPCQLVILGTGKRKYEKKFLNLAKKHPKKLSANITFNVKLAQQIYAGADIFLMPSRFEPCGLGQMIAMRYGTVPVVRATGGLADTVSAKTGFIFKEFSSEALLKTLAKAIKIYQTDPKKWLIMQQQGMKKDFSWNKSAKEYLKLYRKLIK